MTKSKISPPSKTVIELMRDIKSINIRNSDLIEAFIVAQEVYNDETINNNFQIGKTIQLLAKMIQKIAEQASSNYHNIRAEQQRLLDRMNRMESYLSTQTLEIQRLQ